MKPTVLIINGHPRTGKDTFCDFAIPYYNSVKYSSVDTVKEIATIMGWDKTKTPHNREMLSSLKDFTTKWFDMSFNEMIRLIDYENEFNKNPLGSLIIKNTTDFIFLMIREPKEIKKVCAWCLDKEIDCYTVCVTRTGSEITEFSNHADQHVNEMVYDVYISNNSSIEKFKSISERFFNDVLSGEMKKQLL